MKNYHVVAHVTQKGENTKERDITLLYKVEEGMRSQAVPRIAANTLIRCLRPEFRYPCGGTCQFP